MDEENNSGMRQVIEKELDPIPVLLTPKGLHLEDYFTDMSWNDFSTLIESLADEAKVKVLGFCMDFIDDKQYTFVRFKGYSEVKRFIDYVNS